MAENILSSLLAYLCGAIPFGYLAGKLNGIDLREHGSHNIGATNAVRVLGKRWGIPVFLCDFLKGFLPVLLMKQHLGGDATAMDAAQMGWLLGVMAAAVLGHTYTCFLHFRGGKGVATGAGVLLALSGFIGGVAVGVWVLSMVLTRYVSLSSMLAGVAAVVAVLWEFAGDGCISAADVPVIAAIVLLCLLVIVKHRSNVVRLCKGTEPKAFSKNN